MTIGVMLVNDHLFILDTLPNLLRGTDDITVVARCEPRNEALSTVLDRQADVIVLDLRMAVMDGLAVRRALNARRRGVRVVLLTGAGDEAEIAKAVHRGVQGAVFEDAAPRQLLPSIRAVVDRPTMGMPQHSTGPRVPEARARRRHHRKRGPHGGRIGYRPRSRERSSQQGEGSDGTAGSGA